MIPPGLMGISIPSNVDTCPQPKVWRRHELNHTDAIQYLNHSDASQEKVEYNVGHYIHVQPKEIVILSYVHIYNDNNNNDDNDNNNDNNDNDYIYIIIYIYTYYVYIYIYIYTYFSRCPEIL